MNIKTLCLTGALLLTGISIYAQKKKEMTPTLRCIYYNRLTKSLIKNLRLQK